MTMDSERLTISELADRTGLSKHTLRYYERTGLLPLVERDERSGHRRYRPEHVRWVAFLRSLRRTGMPIRDVRTYAGLAGQGAGSWLERRRMLAAHRDRVQQTFEELQHHLDLLDYKLREGCDPVRHEPGTPAEADSIPGMKRRRRATPRMAR